MILFFYGRIRVSENLYSRIFCAVIPGLKISKKAMLQKNWVIFDKIFKLAQENQKEYLQMTFAIEGFL